MAAGLGFKTFTTGEVLTAADVNGYLMQGVLVFASAAARNAAITSPQEGQFAFTKDTNGLWYYDGAAWVASGATGDIEGVTAGVGISGGGTSGTVTITNDMATTITASGDIVVGTGSGTYDNLPIGTTGQVLTADTTVSPYKVKWATAGGGSPLTTKGDLYTYSTADARLPVGANDTMLFADSTQSTGIKWGGGWTNYSPSVGGITKGNGTEVARYRQIGKMVEIFYQFTLGSTSSVTGQVTVNPPINSVYTLAIACGFMSDSGTEYPSGIYMPVNVIYPKSLNTSGTYLANNQLNGTTPFTWGSGDFFNFNFAYEVA